MSTPTPETLAEWRALWTELRDRGGQDVILTPEFALALLDARAAEKAAREEAEEAAAHWQYLRDQERDVARHEKARADRLTFLLGSHADGHRCTCECVKPGSHIEPPEYEQDPWCPTHPDVDYIRQEYDRVKVAREAADRRFLDAVNTLAAEKFKAEQERDEQSRLYEATHLDLCKRDQQLEAAEAALAAALDDTAEKQARADKAEQERDEARRHIASMEKFKHRAEAAEAAYAALVARCKALADKWIAEDDMTQWGVHTKSRCGHALRALTEKEEG